MWKERYASVEVVLLASEGCSLPWKCSEFHARKKVTSLELSFASMKESLCYFHESVFYFHGSCCAFREVGLPPSFRGSGGLLTLHRPLRRAKYISALCGWEQGDTREMSYLGVEVPGGSRVVGKLVGYPMEAESIEAHKTSVKLNPTLVEVKLLPCNLMMKASVEVAGRFYGIYYLVPWEQIQLPRK